MEMKVGQKYRDRYGHLWRVTKHEPHCRAYPFVALAMKDGREETYTAEGRWSRHCEAGCDLVHEAAADATETRESVYAHPV